MLLKLSANTVAGQWRILTALPNTRWREVIVDERSTVKHSPDNDPEDRQHLCFKKAGHEMCPDMSLAPDQSVAESVAGTAGGATPNMMPVSTSNRCPFRS